MLIKCTQMTALPSQVSKLTAAPTAAGRAAAEVTQLATSPAAHLLAAGYSDGTVRCGSRLMLSTRPRIHLEADESSCSRHGMMHWEAPLDVCAMCRCGCGM